MRRFPEPNLDPPEQGPSFCELFGAEDMPADEAAIFENADDSLVSLLERAMTWAYERGRSDEQADHAQGMEVGYVDEF